MKRYWLLIFFCSLVGFGQTQKQHFALSDGALESALAQIEMAFSVKYSYATAIVASKTVTLNGAYSLYEINVEIRRQTGLAVVKIDDRYFALHPENQTITPLDEVLVAGFLSKGINKSAAHFRLSPQKIAELPGVTDTDVLLSLQQLPGVKSPNETASGLHVRGGTPDQNLVLWDGIRLYHPGHLFGMISGLNPNTAQTVHFYNKATNPEFGERVSGIIDIKTPESIDSLTFAAGMNGLNAEASIRIPVMENLGVQVSGRKSFTEFWQSPTFDAYAEKVFQNTDFGSFDRDNRFGFQDYAVKLNYAPNDRNLILISGLAIDNHLDYYTAAQTIGRNQKMDIRNYGFSGKWRSRFGKLVQEFVVHYSAYTFNYENYRQEPQGNYEWFVKKNRVTDSGIGVNYDYSWQESATIHFGYQVSGNDLSHVFLNRFPGLVVELGQGHLMNVSHAGYASLNYAPGAWLFQTGIRYTYFNRLKDDSFEPRALIQRKISNQFTTQVSYERKSQVVSQIRESAMGDLSLENYVWILSDGQQYPVQRANQFTAGLTFKLKSFMVDADLYYKTIDGVTSMAFGFMHQYDSQVHAGKGNSKGIDVLIQKTAPSWRAWLTYTFQDSQNSYEGLNNGEAFPISSDITHWFTLSFHKKWNRFSVSAGWTWHTGKPYSTIGGNQIDTFNDKRLPDYHRLDVSAAYILAKKRSWSGKVGLSILNAYDRNSVISREYERQATGIDDLFAGDFVARDFRTLGFTPNVFVRLEF